MFTQKLSTAAVMMAALAVATAVTFVALIHAYGHIHVFW